VWVRWKTCLDEDVGHEPAIDPHGQLDEVGAH
jgi:hypothetical protein